MSTFEKNLARDWLAFGGAKLPIIPAQHLGRQFMCLHAQVGVSRIAEQQSMEMPSLAPACSGRPYRYAYVTSSRFVGPRGWGPPQVVYPFVNTPTVFLFIVIRRCPCEEAGCVCRQAAHPLFFTLSLDAVPARRQGESADKLQKRLP